MLGSQLASTSPSPEVFQVQVQDIAVSGNNDKVIEETSRVGYDVVIETKGTTDHTMHEDESAEHNTHKSELEAISSKKENFATHNVAKNIEKQQRRVLEADNLFWRKDVENMHGLLESTTVPSAVPAKVGLGALQQKQALRTSSQDKLLARIQELDGKLEDLGHAKDESTPNGGSPQEILKQLEDLEARIINLESEAQIERVAPVAPHAKEQMQGLS